MAQLPVQSVQCFAAMSVAWLYWIHFHSRYLLFWGGWEGCLWQKEVEEVDVDKTTNGQREVNDLQHWIFDVSFIFKCWFSGERIVSVVHHLLQALGMLGSIILFCLFSWKFGLCGFLFFVLVHSIIFTTMDRRKFFKQQKISGPFHLRAKMQQSQGLVLILLSMVNQVNQVKPR